MKLGTTFSHHQIHYLGGDVSEALDKAIELKLDYLRICTYWNEIETDKGKYDWSILAEILDTCEKKQQPVILTLGVKSPRYPEFYFPEWVKHKSPDNNDTQKKILNFIKQAVNNFKHLSCVEYYQVENEALDPSGPDHQIIPLSFLKQEVEFVKKLDTKPVITTLWGNELSKRNFLNQLSSVSDVVGIDLYYQQFITKVLGKSIYKGPTDSQEKIKKILDKTNIETWIMELQAEPWEANQEDYLSPNPTGISPQKIIKYYEKAQRLPVAAIFFWGFEYWFYQLKQHNNCDYFDAILKIRNQS